VARLKSKDGRDGRSQALADRHPGAPVGGFDLPGKRMRGELRLNAREQHASEGGKVTSVSAPLQALTGR